MNKTIQETDLTRTIPPVIAENEDIKALGILIQEELRRINGLIDKNKIFCNISALDEQTLDILAYDLNVLWYDYNYDIRIKREIIKDCIKIYRKLGTPYAVKKALSNVFPDSELKEWFETGGDPFTFEVNINAGADGARKDLQKMALDRIKYYKNLRSHLKKIMYILENRIKLRLGAAYTIAQEIEILPYTIEDIEMHGKIKINMAEVIKQEVLVYPAA